MDGQYSFFIDRLDIMALVKLMNVWGGWRKESSFIRGSVSDLPSPSSLSSPCESLCFRHPPLYHIHTVPYSTWCKRGLSFANETSSSQGYWYLLLSPSNLDAHVRHPLPTVPVRRYVGIMYRWKVSLSTRCYLPKGAEEILV